MVTHDQALSLALQWGWDVIETSEACNALGMGPYYFTKGTQNPYLLLRSCGVWEVSKHVKTADGYDRVWNQVVDSPLQGMQIAQQLKGEAA